MIYLYIVLILIYIISVLGMYKFYQLFYYDYRSWNLFSKPEIIDIVYTFMPIINTFMLLINILTGWKSKEYKTKINFFKPKEKLTKKEL